MRQRMNGRGLHPKVRSSSTRFFTFDDSTIPEVYDAVGATQLVLAAAGSVGTPELIPSMIGGRARAFNRISANSTVLATADASADATAAQGEWTIQSWIRPNAVDNDGPATLPDYIWLLGGDRNLETEVENLQAALTFDLNGNLGVSWESGAGVDRLTAFSTYAVKLKRWIHCTLRKVFVSGSNYTVDLIINGEVIETTASTTNATGGSSANVRWMVGGNLNAANTLADGAIVDVASLHVYSEALPIDEIKKDFRRGQMLDSFTHIDLKVEMADASGNRRELTDLEGLDFVDTVTINENVDNVVHTADVKLLREQQDLSIANLRTDTKLNLTDVDVVTSYDPLVEIKRDIEVFVARVPLGIRATGLDWHSRFLGKVDVVDWGASESVTLKARDKGGEFVDAFIEEEVLDPAIITDAPPEKMPSYGSTSGLALQTIQQSILDDNDNSTANDTTVEGPALTLKTGSYAPTTLVVDGLPAWLLLPYRQRREPVMTAIRNLPGQIGWETRFRHNEGELPEDDSWDLTLYDVERERVDSDILLTERDVESVSALTINVKNIRNVVRVVYPSSEATAPTVPTYAGYTVRSGWSGVDGAGNRMPAWIELEHTASVAKYGRRFMEVGEKSTSQIDTIDEAGRMAFSMIEDLREPDLEKSALMSCLFELELNDVVRFEVIKQLYSVFQKLASATLTHVFGDKATTTAQLRGRPAVGFRRWLRLESRPGMGRPAVIDPRLALTDSERGPKLRIIRELADNLAVLQGGKYLAIQNQNFAQWDAGTENPPTGWQVADTAVWGTDMEEEGSTLASGGHSVRFLTATGRLQMVQAVQADGDLDQPYTVELKYQQVSGTLNTAPRVTVRWFDEAMAELTVGSDGASAHKCVNDVEISTSNRTSNVATIVTSAVHGLSTGDMVSVRINETTAGLVLFDTEKVIITVTNTTTFTYANTGANSGTQATDGSVCERPRFEDCPVPAALGDWVTCRLSGIEPPSEDARFMRVEIEREGANPMIVDRVSAYRTARETRFTQRDSTEVAVGSWRNVQLRSAEPRFDDGFDYGRNFSLDNGISYFVAREDMRVRFFSLVRFEEGTGTITSARIRVVKNETYTGSVPDGVGSVVTIGDDAPAGGAGVATDVALPRVEGEVFLAQGDTLNVERYIDGSVVIVYANFVGEDSFFVVKQEDQD